MAEEQAMDDAWAKVELYRWQYGSLPPDGEACQELIVADGLEGMAKGLRSEEPPSAVGLESVLFAVSRWFRAGAAANAVLDADLLEALDALEATGKSKDDWREKRNAVLAKHGRKA